MTAKLENPLPLLGGLQEHNRANAWKFPTKFPTKFPPRSPQIKSLIQALHLIKLFKPLSFLTLFFSTFFRPFFDPFDLKKVGFPSAFPGNFGKKRPPKFGKVFDYMAIFRFLSSRSAHDGGATWSEAGRRTGRRAQR